MQLIRFSQVEFDLIANREGLSPISTADQLFHLKFSRHLLIPAKLSININWCSKSYLPLVTDSCRVVKTALTLIPSCFLGLFCYHSTSNDKRPFKHRVIFMEDRISIGPDRTLLLSKQAEWSLLDVEFHENNSDAYFQF